MCVPELDEEPEEPPDDPSDEPPDEPSEGPPDDTPEEPDEPELELQSPESSQSVGRRNQHTIQFKIRQKMVIFSSNYDIPLSV